MWLFWKDKIVYVDLLHEWRNIKIWEFNLFERVWVTETFRYAEKRHPSNRFGDNSLKPHAPIDAIIIDVCAETVYSTDLVGFPRFFEKWELDEYVHDTNKITYKAKWYLCIDKKWNKIYAYSVKKNHWELQETFEYMDEVEKKKLVVQQAQHAYEKHLKEMEDLLIKWKDIQKKAFNSIP